MQSAVAVGRVGGLAVALGVGAAILYGAAEAGAEPSARDSASTGEARAVSRPGPKRVAGHPDSLVRAAVAPTRSGARTAVPAPAASATSRPAGRAPSLSDGPSAGVDIPVVLPESPAPAQPAAGRATPAGLTVVPAAATAGTDLATVPQEPLADPKVIVPQPDPSWRDPTATVATPYGVLGKWMLKDGAIANWVDLPYCGAGADCGLLGQYKGKTVQEPINMVFVVEATNKWQAELMLDQSLRKAGFGPSPFSSIGYSGLVGGLVSEQMPRGGIFGLGFLPPLPFGLGGTRGIFPLASQLGVGAAYRDAPFNQANAHLRTFGGVPDGNGNYIFTASVSDEFLLTTYILGIIPNPIPTHGYESFVDARAKLATNLVATGATDLGTLDMQNQIADFYPRYTTGDHDGLAAVIGIGSAGGAQQQRRVVRSRAAAAMTTP